MPIGSTNVYNPGDLILSTVSGSGTSFIETKIIAATSSFILFNSSGTLTSASLNSIVATTSSYVSGSTSIITNLTASNISVSSTGSFGIVGIGTASPAAKLDVSANAVDIAIFRSSGGLANDKRLTITSGGEKVIFNVSDNSNTAIARAYEFQNAGTASMTLNSTGSLQVVNTGRIIGILRASSTPQTTFYDNTFAVNSDGGGANGFIYTSGTGGTFPLDFYGELILQSCPRTGYNNGISLVTGTTSPSVKLRVAENGNVGIGTTLPSEKLHVVGNGLITSGSAVDLRIDVSGTGNASLTIDRQTTGAESKILLLDANVSQWGIAAKADSNNFVIRDADSTERFTILKSGGNVGIGTSSPASKLHISGSGQTIMRLDSDTTSSVSQFQIKAASDAVLIMGMQGGSAASTNFGVTAAGQAYFGTSTLGSPHPTSLVIGNVSNIPIAFSTNNVERMRIDGVGNVGIGTTSATNKLEVIGGTNTRINLGNIDDVNRGGKLEIISGSATARQFYVGTNSAIYNLVFGIDSIEKMRIDTAGNVGIGTTAPGALLEISSSTAASLLNVKGAGGNGILFVSGSGNVGIGTTSPVGKLHVVGGGGSGALVIQGNGITSHFHYGTNEDTYIRPGKTVGAVFIADVGGNVGIGTTTTTAKLHVSGSTGGVFEVDTAGGTTTLYVSASGNVGIGTTTVNHLLHLSTVTADVSIGLYTTNANASARNWLISANEVAYGDFNIKQSNAIGGNPRSAGTSRFYIQNDGNVGIGTTSPADKLSVISGSVRIASSALAGVLYLGNDTSNIYLQRDNNYDLSLVQNGDSNSALYLASAGSVYVNIDSNNNDTDKAFIVQNNALKAGTELFRIQENGNIGIGTTVPTAFVDIQGANVTTFGGSNTGSLGTIFLAGTDEYNSGTAGAGIYFRGKFNSAGTTRTTFGAISGIKENNTDGDFSGALTFFARSGSNTGIIHERMRIGSSGNVGIGTTNPTARLHVSGSTIISGSLNVSANITCLSLTETSTEAVKYNILPLPSQLDNVLKLKPVSFNYKANDKHSIGLIAEEVAKIYPEFTSDNNDSISYGKITSVLIQSIKELKTIIDNQQKQIENLIDKLK